MVEDEQCQAAPFGNLPAGYDPGDPLSSRRVKPLPKRRRTIAPPPPLENPPRLDNTDFRSSLPEDLARALPDGAVGSNGHHAPIFSGVPGLFGDDIDSRHVAPVDFDGRAGVMDGGRFAAAARQDDVDAGDYVDFIRRPNNTKKRKVPVAAHSRRDDGAMDSLGGEEELADRLLLPSLPDRTLIETAESALPPWSHGAVRSNLSRAARAALQHKELLKSRKRQLAAVLGAISLGDPLALDQALSSPYFLPRPTKSPSGQALEGPTLRASRRLARRKARTLALSNTKTSSSSEVQDENAGLRTAEFTFEERSATSERLRATKQEVATLHKRFEAELARRAAQQQQQQQQAAPAVGSSPVRKSGREARSQQRARIGNGADGDVASLASNKVPASAKTKSKKTKRSALANASNPHHLRNYVPSRLPHQGGGGGNNMHSGSTTIVNAQNYFGLFPLRFLSAELPRRRSKKGGATATTAPFAANLTNPEEEWICPFCEYDLFYGDDQSYRRAIRQRKKILARRRRAMERAAAAAAGRKKGVAPSEYSDSDADDDVEDELAEAAEDGLAHVGAANSKPTKAKEQERDRDKERG